MAGSSFLDTTRSPESLPRDWLLRGLTGLCDEVAQITVTRMETFFSFFFFNV